MCQIGEMHHQLAGLWSRSETLDATGNTSEEGSTMKTIGFAALIAGGLAATVFGFATPAQADPGGTSGPHYSVDNHDEINTTGGFVDLPF